MDRLQERLEVAERALASFQEAVAYGHEPTVVERESALLCLACAVEAVWKASQLFLHEREGIDEGSPKGCVRSSVETGLLNTDEGEWALRAIDDRNLIVHAYNELARAIHRRISRHAQTLEAWLQGLSRRSR